MGGLSTPSHTPATHAHYTCPHVCAGRVSCGVWYLWCLCRYVYLWCACRRARARLRGYPSQTPSPFWAFFTINSFCAICAVCAQSTVYPSSYHIKREHGSGAKWPRLRPPQRILAEPLQSLEHPLRCPGFSCVARVLRSDDQKRRGIVARFRVLQWRLI